MIKNSLPLLTLFAALGCGLMGGLLFAFSNFVMKALMQQSAANGIATMQAINVLIINPLFLLIFIGTALSCLALAVMSLMRWSQPGAAMLLTGSVIYLIGTLIVTMAFNVPLNNALVALSAPSADAAQQWQDYVSAWLRWNHVRAIAALAAAAIFIIAHGQLQTAVS
jgi:uncharacterized membrane protein